MRTCIRFFAFLTLATFSAACGGGGGGSGGLLRVRLLFAGDPNYAADVVSKLQGTGSFASVDSVDVSSVAITAGETSAGADVVLVMKDGSFYDVDDFGDVLADLVDDGVGVVLSVFCYETGVIGGRFALDDYFTMTTGTSAGGPLGFTVDAPLHPLLTGVNVFGGGDSSFRTTGTPYVDSTKVASWFTGGSPPLLVERTLPNGRVRVDVGFYPPTSETPGRPDFVSPQDSVRMLANALLRVGGQL